MELTNKYKHKLRKAQQSKEALEKVLNKKHENEITDRENLITVSCGAQNLLLAAEEMGISAHWASGKPTRTPEITNYLGFAEDEILIGIFPMGYIDKKSTSKRSAQKKFVRWL